MIDTINTIYRIDCINQYKYNRYNWSYRLTLHISPTQLQHYCFLFRFAWLIKVRSILVLHPVSSFWYDHLCFIFLLLFTTQSYSGIHSIGDTDLPTRNGLFLCISRSAIYSWISSTNITLFLCSRRYQLQQWGYKNHVKSHSIWWSSNQWCSTFDLGLWWGL